MFFMGAFDVAGMVNLFYGSRGSGHPLSGQSHVALKYEIADFGFWIAEGRHESAIRNPQSAID